MRYNPATCTANHNHQPMTYAIIETGGKQFRVETGRFYDIELLAAQPDETVTIEKVLLVQHNDDVTIGQPFVEGATVQGTVMRHLRGRKVLVYKMKPKKKTRKKRGHRQEITRLMINSINLNGSALTPAQTTQTAASENQAELTPAETTQTVASENQADTPEDTAAE